MYAFDYVLRPQFPIGFADGSLAVEPLRLDGIEPRTLRGQFAGKNPDSALFLHLLVVLMDSLC
jgi:hypothetical protein